MDKFKSYRRRAVLWVVVSVLFAILMIWLAGHNFVQERYWLASFDIALAILHLWNADRWIKMYHDWVNLGKAEDSLQVMKDEIDKYEREHNV